MFSAFQSTGALPDNPFFPVNLAGGSGERCWPLSRRHRSKQVLTLEHQPKLYRQLETAMSAPVGQSRVRGHEIFPQFEKMTIDYAILEKSSDVVVIPAEIGWDDLGDWNALERLMKAEGENVTVGRHVSLDTGGAILYTTNGDDLIATIGLDDVVVVRADDVTLVVRKDRTQDIKKVVQQLKAHPELERFV